jgi:predicted AAA+ superfamily ATPase
MRTIVGTRGSGKTYKLVAEANLLSSYGERCVFIVHTKEFEATLRRAGLSRDIPVITLSEYGRDKSMYVDYYIFLDEVEFVLRQMFRGKNLAVTIDKENMTETDWRKR